MSTAKIGRARRVDPAVEIDLDDGRAADYASAFAVDVTGSQSAERWVAERWAASILEGAPPLLRWFVVLGWKLVLRLRLAPRGTAGTIAGWSSTTGPTPDSITLDVGSSLVAARKVLTVEPDRVTLATYVRFHGTRGRILWSAIAPVHHRIEPLLMTMAESRRRADAAGFGQ